MKKITKNSKLIIYVDDEEIHYNIGDIIQKEADEDDEIRLEFKNYNQKLKEIS